MPICACVRHTDRQQTERQTDRPARVPVSVAAGGKGDSLGTKGDSPCRILRPIPCMYACTINTYIVVYEASHACVARTHNRHTHTSHMMHSHVRPWNARTITRIYRRLLRPSQSGQPAQVPVWNGCVSVPGSTATLIPPSPPPAPRFFSRFPCLLCSQRVVGSLSVSGLALAAHQRRRAEDEVGGYPFPLTAIDAPRTEGACVSV